MKTGLFSLKKRDFVKGLIMAIATAVLTAVYSFIEAGGLPTKDQWKNVLMIGIGAGITYLIKNFLTPTNVEAAEIVDKETINNLFSEL